MGDLIRVNFRPNHYSLRQAREFLGGGFFRKALFDWSLEELERTANAGEACLTDAGDAYSAILRFRQARLEVRPTESERASCQVIAFPVLRKAAA